MRVVIEAAFIDWRSLFALIYSVIRCSYVPL